MKNYLVKNFDLFFLFIGEDNQSYKFDICNGDDLNILNNEKKYIKKDFINKLIKLSKGFVQKYLDLINNEISNERNLHITKIETKGIKYFLIKKKQKKMKNKRKNKMKRKKKSKIKMI